MNIQALLQYAYSSIFAGPKVKINPEKKLPIDVQKHLSKFLMTKDLGKWSGVNKAMFKNEVVSQEQMMKSAIIGCQFYEDLGIKVGEEPPLPADWVKMMKSSSSIDSKASVIEKNMIVMIPKTMNGEPTTLRNFLNILDALMINNDPSETFETIIESIVDDPRDELAFSLDPVAAENKPKKKFDGAIWDRIFEVTADGKIENSYWLVMTKDMLPLSIGKKFDEQEKIAREHGYEAPELLPAFIAMCMHFIKTGTTHYCRDPGMFTRCNENKYDNDGHAAIGALGPLGFYIHRPAGISPKYLGMAGTNKLGKMSTII